MTDLKEEVNKTLTKWARYPDVLGDSCFYRLLDMKNGRVAPLMSRTELSIMNKTFSDAEASPSSYRLDKRKDSLADSVKSRIRMDRDLPERLRKMAESAETPSGKLLIKSMDIILKFTTMSLKQILDDISEAKDVETLNKLDAKAQYIYESFTGLWIDAVDEVNDNGKL